MCNQLHNRFLLSYFYLLYGTARRVFVMMCIYHSELCATTWLVVANS